MSGTTAPNPDVDALFKLPLDEFTAARNALAARLKKAGHQAEASATKALVKPSVSAWVVNQIYWRHRGLFDRLIEAGDRVRRTQAQLTSEAARESVNTRREAVAALTAIAEGLLRGGNYNATRDVLRRVTSTLEALSSYGSLPGAPVAGRLIDDVQPPGFGAVAGFRPESSARSAGGTQSPKRLPHAEPAQKGPASRDSAAARRDEEHRKKLISAAKAAVREAERAMNVARKQAERAAAKVGAAERRAREIEAQRARMEKQYARVAREAEAAQQSAREATASANEATQAVEAAARALELARRELQETVLVRRQPLS
jgi:hypothetical protein